MTHPSALQRLPAARWAAAAAAVAATLCLSACAWRTPVQWLPALPSLPTGWLHSAPPTVAPTTQVVIIDVTVVHPDRSAATAVVPHQTIVIDNGRIQVVGPQEQIKLPPGARALDGHGRWVVPGLIDSHVHFFQSGNLYTRPDVVNFNRWRPYAQEDARNRKRLDATFKVWLASGVTGVVDVGGPLWNFEVRERASHTPAAPHVAMAGPLISTVEAPELNVGDDPPIAYVAGVDQAIAQAQRQLERKPDYLKVWFVHRPSSDNLAAQTELVAAVARTAHAAGVPLAVHATQLPVAKAALRAGADYLVHSVEDAPVDAEFMALLRERPQVLYCPTLYVVQGYQEMLSNRWSATPEEQRLADPEVLASMRDLSRIPPPLIPEGIAKAVAAATPLRPPAQLQRNLRVLWDAGVTVVMGTDAGNIGTLHGPAIFREMALMQGAGLTPLQVLKAATVNGARALRMPDQTGLIAPGYRADLLILEADPLQDVHNLARAWRVLKDGQVFDPTELVAGLQQP